MAFFEQVNLVSVSFPVSLKTFYSSTFGNCNSLTSLTFPAGSALTNIPDDAFVDCGITTLNWGVSGTTPVIFGINAFGSPSTVTTLNILDGVTEIADEQFDITINPWTALLTTLNLPTTLETIGDYAFWGCSGLTSLTFPAGSALTTIGDGAFYDCGITTLNWGVSGTTPVIFGINAFGSPRTVTTLNILEGVTDIIGQYPSQFSG